MEELQIQVFGTLKEHITYTSKGPKSEVVSSPHRNEKNSLVRPLLYQSWDEQKRPQLFPEVSVVATVSYFWSNYSDLTRPHPKWWCSKGHPLISGKSRLVKYCSCLGPDLPVVSVALHVVEQTGS